MSTQHIQILRYLWAGLRLDNKAVTAPNGNIVQAVRFTTIQQMLTRGWIERDPATTRYRLTTEGRARALVKVRVEDFLTDLTTHPTT